MIAQQHPCLLVEDIVARRGDELIFTYSRYEVADPGFQAMAPRSTILRVRARDVTPDWLIDRFAELRPNEEMAWHSLVEYKGAGFHIPMIDFISRPTHSVLRELVRILATMGFSDHFLLFETGRSFHGYFPDVIPEQAWRKYLDGLLVLDNNDGSSVIDRRWVGHAFVRGFAALRWSHNTSRYRAMPHLTSFVDHADNGDVLSGPKPQV